MVCAYFRNEWDLCYEQIIVYKISRAVEFSQWNWRYSNRVSAVEIIHHEISLIIKTSFGLGVRISVHSETSN